MATGPGNCRGGPARSRARGLSLIFALVTLVALSLAAVALIRSVDTGTLILGNLSFKQDTLLAADDASRQGVAWLSNHIASPALQGDVPDSGYYASTKDSATNPLDATGHSVPRTSPLYTARVVIDWDSDAATPTCTTYEGGSFSGCLRSYAVPSSAGRADMKARYVILRVCDAAGDPAASGSGINCARPMTAGAGGSTERGSFSYANAQRIGSAGVPLYFRVLVRAKGVRETVTFTETLVHF